MATRRVPESDKASEQAAAALAKVVDEVVSRRVTGATENAIIWHDEVTEVLRGNQYASGGWVHSPATIQIFKATESRLDKLGVKYNLPEAQVTRVRACRIAGTKKIYIIPAAANDDTALEVIRNLKGAWINLYKLLVPGKLGVPSGYKERYDIIEEDDSPVGPALLLDMSNRKERRKVKTSSKKKAAAKKAKAAPAASAPEPAAEGQAQA